MQVKFGSKKQDRIQFKDITQRVFFPALICQVKQIKRRLQATTLQVNLGGEGERGQTLLSSVRPSALAPKSLTLTRRELVSL